MRTPSLISLTHVSLEACKSYYTPRKDSSRVCICSLHATVWLLLKFAREQTFVDLKYSVTKVPTVRAEDSSSPYAWARSLNPVKPESSEYCGYCENLVQDEEN